MGVISVAIIITESATRARVKNNVPINVFPQRGGVAGLP